MRLTKKVVVLAGLAALTVVTALLISHFAFAQQTPAFRFVTVERGDLQALVSATGALNAVTTVSVGTQVSGIVSELLVDFNAQVKKGQLLARIDPTLAQQLVPRLLIGSSSRRRRLARWRRLRDVAPFKPRWLSKGAAMSSRGSS